MPNREFMTWLLAGLILISLQAIVLAAGPTNSGQGEDYVVQADDWLSKLADKFYGDPLAYPVIVEATNLRAAEDSSYAYIDDPNVIEIGQKLFVPAEVEANAEFMAEEVPEQEEVEAVGVVAAPEENLAPTEEQLQLLAGLADKGVPPELHNEVWLNSEPLKLADLRGKVVIVEFWTFG